MARVFSHEPINFRTMPPAIKWILIANLAGFCLAQIVGPQFFELFGLIPRSVIVDRWVWQPFTYLFIHGNFMHLLFNLFALWMFGMPVEAQWGSKDFVKYYMLCGLGAALAQLIVGPFSRSPVIGASGPVYGLLVAFAMLYPDSVVYLYFMVPIAASHMAILYGVIVFFSGISGSSPGVAHFAHLGGMLTGYIYLRWWWLLKIKVKAMLSGFGEAPDPGTAPNRRVRRVPSAAPAAEETMEEIDRILDKILVSGLESLTEEERALMRRYSGRTPGPKPPQGGTA